MFKNCCRPVCIDHTDIKLLVPGLHVDSNGKTGNQYLEIMGYTGHLYFHYWPPVDLEPAINVDMSLYSHKNTYKMLIQNLSLISNIT